VVHKLRQNGGLTLPTGDDGLQSTATTVKT